MLERSLTESLFSISFQISSGMFDMSSGLFLLLLLEEVTDLHPLSVVAKADLYPSSPVEDEETNLWSSSEYFSMACICPIKEEISMIMNIMRYKTATNEKDLDSLDDTMLEDMRAGVDACVNNIRKKCYNK
jgi:hypothetical protein